MVKGGRFPEEKLYRDVEARAFDRSRLKSPPKKEGKESFMFANLSFTSV